MIVRTVPTETRAATMMKRVQEAGVTLGVAWAEEERAEEAGKGASKSLQKPFRRSFSSFCSSVDCVVWCVCVYGFGGIGGSF